MTKKKKTTKEEEEETKITATASFAASSICEDDEEERGWDDFDIIKTKSILVADCGGTTLTLCFAEVCPAAAGCCACADDCCGWCSYRETFGKKQQQPATTYIDGKKKEEEEDSNDDDEQEGDADYHLLLSKGKGFNPFLSEPREMKERIITALSNVPENENDPIDMLPKIYQCLLRLPPKPEHLSGIGSGRSCDRHNVLNDIRSENPGQRLEWLLQGESIPNVLDEIHWYGAGCETPETAAKVRDVLESIFCGSSRSGSSTEAAEPKKKKSKTGRGKGKGASAASSGSDDSDSNPWPKIFIYHDLLAAARTTCGREPGHVAILGTGSNSCFYDGTNIVEQGPSLGYLLGDEGSGCDLGKTLIREYLLGRMPDDVAASFKKSYLCKGRKGGSGTQYEPDDKLLQKVYGNDQPNSYLASFAEFYQYESGLTTDGKLFLKELAKSRFREFVNVNLKQYKHETSNKKDDGKEKMKINFVGSIAHHFKDLIEPVLHEAGFEMGNIPKDGGPLEFDILYDLGDLWANCLIEFHLMS
mmetsp:Transcript_52126/g.125862  ORF Transcript_52126/g.125862 Transcript_52126/m.125862 type:complete len:531 (-) Transcript_52126:101-1693(-)